MNYDERYEIHWLAYGVGWSVYEGYGNYEDAQEAYNNAISVGRGSYRLVRVSLATLSQCSRGV